MGSGNHFLKRILEHDAAFIQVCTLGYYFRSFYNLSHIAAGDSGVFRGKICIHQDPLMHIVLEEQRIVEIVL